MKITLKAARVNAGMTPKQAAEAIGCTVMTLYRWEKEPGNVRAKKQALIAKAYGISVDNIEWANK